MGRLRDRAKIGEEMVQKWCKIVRLDGMTRETRTTGTERRGAKSFASG